MRPPPSGHCTRWEPQSEHTGSGRQRTVTGGGRGALEGSRGGLPMLTLTVKSEGTAVGPCQAVGTACAARSRCRPGSEMQRRASAGRAGAGLQGGWGPRAWLQPPGEAGFLLSWGRGLGRSVTCHLSRTPEQLRGTSCGERGRWGGGCGSRLLGRRRPQDLFRMQKLEVAEEGERGAGRSWGHAYEHPGGDAGQETRWGDPSP